MYFKKIEIGLEFNRKNTNWINVLFKIIYSE